MTLDEITERRADLRDVLWNNRETVLDIIEKLDRREGWFNKAIGIPDAVTLLGALADYTTLEFMADAEDGLDTEPDANPPIDWDLARVYAKLSCSKCNTRCIVDACSPNCITKSLAADGWRTDTGGNLCPRCSGVNPAWNPTCSDCGGECHEDEPDDE